mgnify:CR=1 FL=1
MRILYFVHLSKYFEENGVNFQSTKLTMFAIKSN